MPFNDGRTVSFARVVFRGARPIPKDIENVRDIAGFICLRMVVLLEYSQSIRGMLRSGLITRDFE